MSVEQYQRNVNSLDKEIASLEKKKAEADKKCAELQKKINSTQKSITSRTSASMTASKMKQIAAWQSDYAKKAVSYTHLDVYKRQLIRLNTARLITVIQSLMRLI